MLDQVLSDLGKFALWLLLFTAPAHASMLTVCIVVVLDLIVGIWAAVKQGQKITSYGLRRTVTQKILPYQVAILCAWLIETQFFSLIPLMKAVAGFIAVTESKSVFENLARITGLNFWEVIKERLQPSASANINPNRPADDTNDK